jgi:hypothetical protein
MQLYSEILLNNLKTVRKEIKPTFDALFIGKENEIRTMIKNRWTLGKKPDGTRIGFYSKSSSFEINRKAGFNKYSPFKHELNPLAGAGIVDLTLTGSLGNKIELFNEKYRIEIFSTDLKYEEIIKHYGEENFNLTPIETELLIDEIQTLTLELIYKEYVL